MKVAKWKREVSALTGPLPGFRPMQRGFVKVNEWTAECLIVDPSSFSAESFYNEMFPMPRFIPADGLHWTYGFRVGLGLHGFPPELGQAILDALPRLARAATLDGLQAVADDDGRNVRDTELLLCIAILKADERLFEKAVAHLEQRRLRDDDMRPFVIEVLERSEMLAALVSDQGFAAGVDVLASRREQVDRLLV